jgi:hypothetical protein
MRRRMSEDAETPKFDEVLRFLAGLGRMTGE